MNKIPGRPVYLNLIQIRMPVTAVVSILHRFSGAAWILCLPVLVYLLELSLRNENTFEQVLLWFQPTWIKMLLVILLWLLCHHFFAGVRFLLLDMDIGISKTLARASAWWLQLASLLATVILAGALF